jgi:hypothetical protein
MSDKERKKPYVAILPPSTIEGLRNRAKGLDRSIQSLIREGVDHVLAQYPAFPEVVQDCPPVAE